MKNFREIVGKKIRKRRVEVGFKTASSLAEHLKLDIARVSNWERGRHLPEGLHKEKLLEALEADESLLDVGVEVEPGYDELIEVIGAWKSAGEHRRAMALYFLTGSYKHLKNVAEILRPEIELIQTHLDQIAGPSRRAR